MILGSNDGHVVDTLDTRINVPLTGGVNTTFALPITGSYKYYYVYLFTGFSTTGDWLEVHLFAGAQEPTPVFAYVAGEAQPVDPVMPILATAALIAVAGRRTFIRHKKEESI